MFPEKSSQTMKSGQTMQMFLFLLLVAGGHGQSGDDEGGRLTCWSDISKYQRNSLTCRVTDEDEDDGTIDRITICFRDIYRGGVKCLSERNATLTHSDLHPLGNFSVTVHLKNGDSIRTTVELTTIVKPRRPEVWNVTQNQEHNQVLIYIRTPYLADDYLKVQNQLFQVHLWTARNKMIQNVSSSDYLALELEHLQGEAEYQVRVRSIPQINLHGIWSDWSNTYSFSTLARQDPSRGPPDSGPGAWWSALVVLSFTPVLAAFLFFWKQKIFRYLWPQIPKPPLVEICTSTRGLLLHFTPENFSPLTLEKHRSATTSSTSGSWNKKQLIDQSSGHGNSLIFVVKTAEGSGTSCKEDAYVTMSGFYQV